MKTILFTELRDGDWFRFEDGGSVYEYRGNGWFNIPYSGGPWHIESSKGMLKDHGRVIVVELASWNHAKLGRIIHGNREIVDDGFLESVARTDYGSEIRTCRNRQRVGLRDQYVAWIVDEAVPKDLEFCDGYAVGSK